MRTWITRIALFSCLNLFLAFAQTVSAQANASNFPDSAPTLPTAGIATPPSNVKGNVAEAIQDGNNLKATQWQSGEGNLVSIQQMGSLHEATQEQEGNRNHSVTVQAGTDNEANIDIYGDWNETYIDQDDPNSIDNLTTINMDGSYNYSHVKQVGGPDNVVTVTVDGDDNHSLIEQNGSDNQATLQQMGQMNQAIITQHGTGNRATVTQTNR